ncbi:MULTISPECIES: glycosyltransferase [Catenuloplanes]|uniref:Glycosyltransferase involved in cell wall biosynthesis n=1 Tax=Catenuloplanes niger TaxID=587534 RepID=A0AAE4CVA2_9ACTN|nr:glycosyltransferase [Catenuloplanes niger]MDR7322604.1 glycosyltransferase involved in cell wall biosynthesis [Catenuloplanes niger]
MRTYGFLSTHPPTRCGLATFNAALAAELDGGIVRVLDGSIAGQAPPGVVHTWSSRSRGGWPAAAAALDGFDVAIVQHEYGIYPGADGEEVLPLLRRLTVPSIVVLHTVLTHPSERQRSLLTQIVGAAGAVVTMTHTARERLLAGYPVDPSKVTVIPHGTAGPVGGPAARRERPHLLTWGLIGPGKGIEWTLRALARLRDLEPAPTYTVAGRTHPKVLELHGEAYRAGLHQLGAELGVAHTVDYQQVYHDQAALGALIRSADVVVLPYDSREQVTSGVLIEAVAAGVPVVATPFPHAVELLTDGPGLLVPYRDPKALAKAIRRLLTVPGLAARLSRNSGAQLRWPAVARGYAELADRLLAARPGTVGAAAA